MKSGRLALNVLIDLYKIGIETKATFDFINKTIEPKEAESDKNRQLLNDYLNWLPDHFEKHNCDLVKLEKLEVSIWCDFKKANTPHGMKNCKEFEVCTLTKWKADQRDENSIEISQTEIVKQTFLKMGIPEIE